MDIKVHEHSELVPSMLRLGKEASKLDIKRLNCVVSYTFY